MMMMWSLIFLHLLTFTFVLCSTSDTDLSVCPQTCICRTSGALDEVTCHNLNLTSIPRGLPSSVVRLDLANNTLTVLDVAQFHFLRRPAEVVLTGNRIQSFIDSRRPEEGTPVQVQILWLGHNRLSSIGAPAMGALTETLVQLDLSDNRLTSVEGSFVGCRLLSRLDLRQNLLTQITSSTFRDLVSLRYLRLEDNLISTVSVNAFLHLQHLSYLVLKGNPIGTTSTSTTTTTLANQTQEFRFNTGFLSYLDLSVAEFQTVPQGLPPSIRYLQLRKNRLTILSMKDFEGLRQLGILILDDNEIEDIEDGTFENLVQLSQLWMNGNQLKDIPGRLPSGVQRLLLDSNRIRTVTDRSFVGLSQVRTLSLMGNSIAGIEAGTFDVLTQLTSLDLSGNRIRRIVPGTFRRNTLLQVLHLSKNPLHSLDAGSFEGLSRLDQLTASYIPPPSSSSSSFDLDALADLPRLTRLDLEGSTDVIRALVASGPRLRPLFLSLRELNLIKSDLDSLPQDFLSSLPQLISFRVSSDRWHCDRSLLWLREWLANASVATGDNRCLSPHHVIGRLLTSLVDNEFAASPVITITTTDKRHHSTTHSFPLEETALFQANRSVTIATAATGKDPTVVGEVVDLRTKRPKARTKDLQPTHARPQWPITGLAPLINDADTDSIPITPDVLGTPPDTNTGGPWVKVKAAVTTPVSPVTSLHPIISPYPDHLNVSFRFLLSNKTSGYIRTPTGNNNNVTSADHIGNDVIVPAKHALSFDAMVAMGTVAGTVVTAVVMVAVIVHLCRKEKGGVEPPAAAAVSRGQQKKKTAQVGQGHGESEEEEREVVYCTPDLYADAESADRTATNPRGRGDPHAGGPSGRERTLGGNNRDSRASGSSRHSTTREADWPSAGHVARMSTASSKACWDASASEATTLMGRNCAAADSVTQMRVYKWEEL